MMEQKSLVHRTKTKALAVRDQIVYAAGRVGVLGGGHSGISLGHIADHNLIDAAIADPHPGATLNAAFAKPLRNTVVIFGDSITAQNGLGAQSLAAPGGADSSIYTASNGYWVWANAYLGQRAALVYNAGVGGDTTTMMLARIQTDVMAHPSDWVVFCGGANDVAQDVPLATIQTNITAILDLLAAGGRRVLILNVLPSTNYSTTARRAVLGGVNKWIQGLPQTRANLAAVDVWRVLANPDTGSPATGMSMDGIVHPSDAGAQRMGKAIFDVLDPLMPRRPNRAVGLLDPDNIIANPSLTSGTGWSALDVGFTMAYVAADDRWSTKAVMTATAITTIAEHGIQLIEPISNGRYAVGDVIQASARFKWSNATAVTNATGTFRPWIRLYCRLADSSFTERTLAMFCAGANSVQPVGNQIAAGEIVATTFKITVPALVANLYVGFGWQGMATGTLEISDVAVYKNA